MADNAGLVAAARHGEVVPAFVADDRPAAGGNPRRSAYAAAALASLASDLAGLGTHLVYRHGARVAATLRLARDAGAATVTYAHAYDAATRAVQNDVHLALEAAGFRVVAVHDAPAVAPDATAAVHSDGDGYRALTPYVAAWSACARDPVAGGVAFAAHDLESDLHAADVPVATPGDAHAPNERALLAAFEAYLTNGALQYPGARDVPAGPPTARLSAALGRGVVSARTLLARIDARRRDPFLLTEERLALAAFARALAVRDFFLQLAWFFEDEPGRPLQTRMRAFPAVTEHAALAAWRAGRTGYPLVDAGIRQLHATGWMHPRARRVAASFLCFDLGVDWRVGRDDWDAWLVEDDAALASGNWQWVAGVGADLAQVPRIYNPRKQARTFDPAGDYVRRWIPELAGVDVPGASATRARQLPLELSAGVAYPAPVVDHDAAARAYLARYAAFRRGETVTP